MPTQAEIEAIRERAEKATPGPWALWTGCSWRRFGSEATGKTVCEPCTYSDRDRHPDLEFRNGGQDGPDAIFLAGARTDVPTLLAAYDHLAGVLDELLAATEQWAGCTSHETAARLGAAWAAAREARLSQ